MRFRRTHQKLNVSHVEGPSSKLRHRLDTTVGSQPPTTAERLPLSPLHNLAVSDPRVLVPLSGLAEANPVLLDVVARAFPTFGALASASPSERATVSRWLEAQTLPAVLPYPHHPHLSHPHGFSVISFTDPAYPHVLTGLTRAAPVLYFDGTLPSASASFPSLGVVGDRHPTPTASAVARIAAHFANIHRLPVVTMLGSGTGDTAARAGLDAGATVWAVLPGGFSYQPDPLLVRRIITSGGMVCSPTHWAKPPTRATRLDAQRLVIALSTATLFCSMSAPGDAELAQVENFAREMARPSIAPTPEDPRGIRIGDLGIHMATDRRFRRSRPDLVCTSPSDLDEVLYELAVNPATIVSSVDSAAKPAAAYPQPA